VIELLTRWAADEGAWRPLVAHDPDERFYALVHRDWTAP
jgi:hypothetical protein